MRKVFSLNGLWDISYDGVSFDQKLKVPGNVKITPQSYPEPESLKVWYRKRFSIDNLEDYKHAFLKFYGVDRYTRIELNGKLIGQHTGGFDSFEFEVYDNLSSENILEVFVEDKPLGELENEIVGKQYWYGNSIGIWQDVELLLTGETFIERLLFRLNSSLIKIKANIEGKWDAISYKLYDDQNLILTGISENDEFEIKPDSIKTWSPEEPNLYTLIIEVLKEGKVIDIVKKKTGFRKIEQIGDQIFLNGKPFYMRGLLDQDFYPETNYVPPSKKYIIDELEKIKKTGFNTSRYHVKIPMRDYVETCDNLGVFLWIDLPYANKLDTESKKYLKALRDDVIKRYSGNPSFMFLTLINESWGIDLGNYDEINWLKDFYEESETLVCDRIVIDNSACQGNHHVAGKINDFHFYKSYPDHKEEWEEVIKNFATGEFLPFKIPEQFLPLNHPLHKASIPENLTKKWKKLPKIVSEFGLWGLSDPVFWSGNWERYHFIEGLNINTFRKAAKELYAKTISEISLNTQWAQFWGLKYQIETIRFYSEISGFVLTELSDISWEGNGILDYSRNEKFICSYLKSLNADLLPILRNNSEIFISNVSNTDLEVRLVAEIDGEKLIDIEKNVPAIGTIHVENIDLSNKSGMLYLTAYDKNGFKIGTNFYPLFEFKSQEFTEIYDDIDDEVLAKAEKGDIVFVQLNKAGKYKFFDVIETSFSISKEYLIDWNGDWISTFYYYHPSLLSILNPIYGGQELKEAANPFVIIGGKTLIGKFLGWNFQRSSVLSEIEFGNGKIIVSTLDLKTEIGQALCEALKNTMDYQKNSC